MIATSFNSFVETASDAIRKGLNGEVGQELTKKLLKAKLESNPNMSPEEWKQTKSEFMTFLFVEMVKQSPELMQELARHTYNELRQASNV